MSIYERLGREVGVRTAVDDFYVRVLADPDLAPYFADVDMTELRAHQTKLLVQVTGGPVGYSGRDLADAHRRLDIPDEHFDRVAGHLVATLTGLGVDQGTVEQVGAAVTSYRGDVVSR